MLGVTINNNQELGQSPIGILSKLKFLEKATSLCDGVRAILYKLQNDR